MEDGHSTFTDQLHISILLVQIKVINTIVSKDEYPTFVT